MSVAIDVCRLLILGSVAAVCVVIALAVVAAVLKNTWENWKDGRDNEN